MYLTQTQEQNVTLSNPFYGLSPGIIGGKFLERGRVKKPDQMPYSTQLSEYYLASDLYVGALVDFNKHKFVLLDADEYAFRYMEEHPMEVSDHHTLLCCGVGEVGGQWGVSPLSFFFFFFCGSSNY